MSRKESEGLLKQGAAEVNFQKLLADITAGRVQVVDFGSSLDQQFGLILRSCFFQMPVLNVRTLDAIHLSAAKLAGETEFLATDKRMREAAKRLGFVILPP